MQSGTTPGRRLLLLGGGHSHLHILRMATMAPPVARITLVSPDSHALYSGMVPGTLAGLYARGDARIDLRALATRAGVRFIKDRAVQIDAGRHQVHFEEIPPLSYDVLSVDVGSRPRGLPRCESPLLLPIRPMQGALERIEALVADVSAGRCAGRVVVVGAGAGGIELAFAVQARLAAAGGAGVTVIERDPAPLSAYPARVSNKVVRLLARYGIRFAGESCVTGIGERGVRLAAGSCIEADLVLWATGAESLPIFADSDLATDERGFLLVGDTLRSVGDSTIFAAGDCASLVEYPELPKAGVYAVREGPILWRNLRVALAGGGKMRAYQPQKEFLSLLSTGDGRAVASYHGLVAHGRWVWRLKDWIDRRFVDKHASPRPAQYARSDRPAVMSPSPMGPAPMAPCGGCAAKVGRDVLARVLGRLELPRDPRVVTGLETPDDAAVLVHPEGTHVATTADFFPPFLDDTYVVGEVAAVNAASDLYAMGAEPRAALALVALPAGGEADAEETLDLLLRGALKKLKEMDISLVGGHTIEGEGLLFGFSMIGACAPEALLRKSGAQPGDCLVLTKPLGTGVVLAAARAGSGPAEWTDAAIESMLQCNGGAVAALRRAGVRACTDVTGFGLAGHLREMLQASGCAAEIDVSSLPPLPGALELLEAGVRSSFHDRNSSVRKHVRLGAVAAGAARVELLFDPQTSGGLLAAVPAEAVGSLCEVLRSQGTVGSVIGTVVSGPGEIALVAGRG